MANRFPIVVNTTINRLEELPVNDNINLSGVGIYDGSSSGSSGQFLKSTGSGVAWTGDVLIDGEFTSQGLMKRGATAGAYSIVPDNSANWDTAFGWGNHATQGYLTSVGSINSHTDVTITSPVSGQVLKFDGTNWINSADSGSGSINNSGSGSINNISDIGNVTISSPTSGQVLKFDGTNWVNGTDNTTTGLQSRQTSSATTITIPSQSSANLTITTPKTYALLKIKTSHAAWITLYSDTASRTNDSGRNENTDPSPGSGVLAEIITTSATTQLITPGTIAFNTNGTDETYLKVVNKSAGSAGITVTLTYVRLEV